jgi:hypothetical protein
MTSGIDQTDTRRGQSRTTNAPGSFLGLIRTGLTENGTSKPEPPPTSTNTKTPTGTSQRHRPGRARQHRWRLEEQLPGAYPTQLTRHVAISDLDNIWCVVWILPLHVVWWSGCWLLKVLSRSGGFNPASQSTLTWAVQGTALTKTRKTNTVWYLENRIDHQFSGHLQQREENSRTEPGVNPGLPRSGKWEPNPSKALGCYTLGSGGR